MRRFGTGLRDLEIEDLLLALWTALFYLSDDVREAVDRLGALPPGLRLIALLLLVYGGFYLCLATKAPGEASAGGSDSFPAATARSGRGSTRIGYHLACLSQLVGVPFFAWVLRARDDGEQILWAFIAALAVPFFLLGLRGNARTLSLRARRLAILPLTLFNAWYCCELLVSRYVLEESAIRQLVRALDAGAPGAILLQTLSVAFSSTVLLAVPYVVLVISPRRVAGEQFQARPWIRRYLVLTVTIVAVGLLEAAGASGTAPLEALLRPFFRSSLPG